MIFIETLVIGLIIFGLAAFCLRRIKPKHRDKGCGNDCGCCSSGCEKTGIKSTPDLSSEISAAKTSNNKSGNK